jgi:hypothetical protein
MENHPTDFLASYKVKAIETMWCWFGDWRGGGEGTGKEGGSPETEPCT